MVNNLFLGIIGFERALGLQAQPQSSGFQFHAVSGKLAEKEVDAPVLGLVLPPPRLGNPGSATTGVLFSNCFIFILC